MKAELKFRWVGLNKHFQEIQMNLDLTIDKIMSGSYFSFFNESNRYESGNCEFISEDLSTGFKDKNLNDIYDGDILSDYTKTEEGLKKSHCQVYWCQKTGTWRLDLSNGQNKSYSFPLYRELEDYQYEISGNIYENPEHLLKEMEVNL